jgi:hypothetical protein
VTRKNSSPDRCRGSLNFLALRQDPSDGTSLAGNYGVDAACEVTSAAAEGDALGDALDDGLVLATGLVLALALGLAEGDVEAADVIEEALGLTTGVGHAAAAQRELLLDADGVAVRWPVLDVGLADVAETGLT